MRGQVIMLSRFGTSTGDTVVAVFIAVVVLVAVPLTLGLGSVFFGTVLGRASMPNRYEVRVEVPRPALSSDLAARAQIW